MSSSIEIIQLSDDEENVLLENGPPLDCENFNSKINEQNLAESSYQFESKDRFLDKIIHTDLNSSNEGLDQPSKIVEDDQYNPPYFPVDIEQPTTSHNYQAKAAESDEELDVPPGPKRKRRTKEEIAQDKLQQQVNKIQREMKAAKNSKCEQYLYCHFSETILALNDDIKHELEKRFAERKLEAQLIFDGSNSQGMTVIWKRKRIEAYIEDGMLHSETLMDVQGVFACVLDADSFTPIVKSKLVEEFLRDKIREFDQNDPQLTVIVLGKHHLRENYLAYAVFEAFEKCRVQFRFVKDAVDFGCMVLQMHRSIAKMEKKEEGRINVDTAEEPIAPMEKGVFDGPNLVRDWWERMLDRVHRLSEEQKRAIIQAHPSPFALMDHLLGQTAGDAMFELSEIQTESGRHIGPVFAQKLYKVLTSYDGSEVIETG